MQALTIHHLWAWAIAEGIKRVENRSRRTSYRGPLAIHAGNSRDSLAASRSLLRKLGHNPPPDHKLTFGAVIAVVELVDVIEFDPRRRELLDCSSGLAADPFATGPVCYVLADVKRLRSPVYCRGQQGFWGLDGDLLASVLHELEGSGCATG